MSEVSDEPPERAAAGYAPHDGEGTTPDRADLAHVQRPPGPEPGKPYVFTPGDSSAAEEAVAEVFGAPTGVLGPEDNVAILPVLLSDPAPVLDGRVRPTHDLESRPYGRIIAPSKRAPEVTIELLAAKRAPKPISDLLFEQGIEVPPDWRPRRKRFVSSRRVAWFRIPIEASPPEVLKFVCDALGVIVSTTATGRYMLVRHRGSGFPGGVR